MTSYDHYFDYASTTPVSDTVLQAMQPYWQEAFYNPSALYSGAKAVKADIEAARSIIARELQVRSPEIYFMSGATEANNAVLHGLLSQYNDATVCFSDLEHDSVRKQAAKFGAAVTVTEKGLVDIQALEAAITTQTVVVSCMAANNEIGTLQPLKEIGDIIAAVNAKRHAEGISLPLYFHVDASQSLQYYKFLPQKIGADFVVAGGSKLYGPKQSAFLYVRQGVRLEPLLLGGGQELGLRPGTENAALCIGLATAVAECAAHRNAETERMSSLQKWFTEQLQQLFDVQINGSMQHRLPNNVHATFAGIDNEYVVMALDEIGFQVAAGSACHASSEEPSAVLLAMGLSKEQAQSSLRFTFGRFTTRESLQQLLDALQSILQP